MGREASRCRFRDDDRAAYNVLHQPSAIACVAALVPIAGYVRIAGVVVEAFTNRPGYNSLGANVATLKAGGGKGGFLDHKETADNIRLFARGVFARVKDLTADNSASSCRPVAAE
jgi:hypothetical protein